MAETPDHDSVETQNHDKVTEMGVTLKNLTDVVSELKEVVKVFSVLPSQIATLISRMEEHNVQSLKRAEKYDKELYDQNFRLRTAEKYVTRHDVIWKIGLAAIMASGLTGGLLRFMGG